VPFLWRCFVQFTVLPLQGFEVTYPIFEVFTTLQIRLPDAFCYLVPNNFIFTAKDILKTPNLTYLAVKNASWQSWL